MAPFNGTLSSLGREYTDGIKSNVLVFVKAVEHNFVALMNASSACAVMVAVLQMWQELPGYAACLSKVYQMFLLVRKDTLDAIGAYVEARTSLKAVSFFFNGHNPDY